MDYKPHKEQLRAALVMWGSEQQLRKLQEECCELGAAVNHFFSTRRSLHETEAEIIGEIADVEILLQQARIMFGDERIDVAILKKLVRLQEMIDTGKY